MFPAFEDFGDGSSGGDVPGGQDEHGDQGEEHDGVRGGRGGADGEEDRDVDADVVAAVGEGDRCDGPDGDGLARVVTVVVAATPGPPGGVEARSRGMSPK